MSSAIFRQLASGEEAHKSERLFRAAISAFASLTRPTRSEITQLDDLVRPLYDLVPVETRRYAAAVLCECTAVPADLLKRLAEEPVEISAPLLVRSRALSNIQLIGLIARNGVSHARVIARRATLDPAIAALARAVIAQSESGPITLPPKRPLKPSVIEEAVRRRLRSIMRAPHADPGERLSNPADPALLTAALSGKPDLFAVALAERLDLPEERVRQMIGTADGGDLMVALRALALGEAEAFLLTATQCPGRYDSRDAVSAFIARFRSLPTDAAQRQVRAWRGEDGRTALGSGLPGEAQPVAISK